jgi:selenocysteine lyase/cysteine desulfurase
MEDVQIYGITDPANFDRRVPTVSFTVRGRRPEEVAERLGERGIYSWAGDHYAVEPLGRLRLESTQRIGLVHYNTADEVDRFLAALAEIIREPPPVG